MNQYKMFLVLTFLFILFYSVKSIWYLFRKKKGRRCCIMGCILFLTIVFFPFIDCEISMHCDVPMGSVYSLVFLLTSIVAKSIIVMLETKYQIDNEKMISKYDRRTPLLSLLMILLIMEWYSNTWMLNSQKIYEWAVLVSLVDSAVILYYYIKNTRKGYNEENRKD